MTRSFKKGPFCDNYLIEKIKLAKLNKSYIPIKTWSRRSTILPIFIGMNISVHNGKKHINIYISEDMVGHKLGEFVMTRIFKNHSSSKKVKNKFN